MIIQAAIAPSREAPFELRDVSLDTPRPNEILVRIWGVGICHTDLAVRDQHIPIQLPAVLGHEGAGVVEAVGSEVTKVAPGDRVVLTFRSCGACKTCSAGHPSYCSDLGVLNASGRRLDGSSTIHVDGVPLGCNFFGQSSFAQYALAYERNVVKVPANVALQLMGPLGCGVQTGVGAVMRSMSCAAGSSILILGGGAVGLSAVLGAVIQECATIIVSEPVAARRSLALELGATHVLDPVGCDLTVATRAIVAAGVDYAFDTTARPDVILAAIASLGPRGEIGLVGVSPAADTALQLELRTLGARGITIRGIVEGDSDPAIFIPELLELHRTGRLPFEKMITTYPIADINRAVDDHVSGRVVKAVLLTDAARPAF